ncbi:hypothetical protein HDV05_003119, partial [Chytridiales sp. JEL 0842]
MLTGREPPHPSLKVQAVQDLTKDLKGCSALVATTQPKQNSDGKTAKNPKGAGSRKGVLSKSTFTKETLEKTRSLDTFFKPKMEVEIQLKKQTDEVESPSVELLQPQLASDNASFRAEIPSSSIQPQQENTNEALSEPIFDSPIQLPRD